MHVLGLTGSIGMGKSTAARMFQRLKVPVHDADAVVHQLMGKNGAAVKDISALFPETKTNNGIDRKKLGDAVFRQPEKLKQLEAILHPLVRQKMHRFIDRYARQRRELVVLDIPLLFETGGDRFCDSVLVISCPKYIQDQRVLSRKGMTAEKYQGILKKQMPDMEKRARADFVIRSNQGRRYSFQQVQQIVEKLGSSDKSAHGTKDRKFCPHLSLIYKQ
ncbi:dephospho-CoA kinase [Kiloniella litopenaei]|uniref:Dephospho-CoA kinase n=1 Tax=Kiloniella litopenaei TaxID=1549748 RepID=A0A0M2R619_9PROT|nr:dephospho-CoA kinase [Kiloniella litopenaei]KKJ77121.1 dephospho-CoA kinase [Kiloniella litopenaei]